MKFRLVVCLFLGLSCLPLNAERPSPPGNFSFWGEYLYLKPSIDQSFFALVQEDLDNDTFTSGTTQRFNNPYGFGSAWRVGGEYASCDAINDIHIEGTYLHRKAHREVSGSFVSAVDYFPSIGTVGAGSAISNNEFTYYAIDLLFGHSLYNCCPFTLYIEGGAQFMHLNAEKKTQINNPAIPGVTIPSAKDHNWALGPEVGAEVTYQLPFCSENHFFSLIAKGRGALLVNRTHFKLNQIVNTSTLNRQLNFDNDPHYRIVPFGDIRLGIEYCSIPCGCRSLLLNIEIGYEFMTYNRLVDWVHFDATSNTGSSFDNYSDFDLQGPYIAVKISF